MMNVEVIDEQTQGAEDMDASGMKSKKTYQKWIRRARKRPS